ncbi:MAG: hypothetical protein ACXWN4_07940 [Candidatus Limnocylindrales bacterium]
MNGPWNQLNLLFTAFNDGNFPRLWTPAWQISIAFLFVVLFYYNFQARRLRAYSVFLDLNEWLMWTTLGVFGMLTLFTLFSFDFMFALPTIIGGAVLFIWIRFIHFPPLIRSYEERLARQRYFQRSRTSHPEATIRAKATPKAKRRRR